MSDVVVTAIIGLLGSSVGAFGGILASSKLVNHRIQELEKRVDKHNNVVERTFILEGRVREAEHDIIDIKNKKGAD